MADPVTPFRGGLSAMRRTRGALLRRLEDEGFDTSRTWYHGTSSSEPFTTFEQGPYGTWFARKPEYAEYYSGGVDDYPGSSPQIFPVYLRMRNPITMRKHMDFDNPDLIDYLSKLGTPEQNKYLPSASDDRYWNWGDRREILDQIRSLRGRRPASHLHELLGGRDKGDPFMTSDQGYIFKDIADLLGHDSMIWREGEYGDTAAAIYDPRNIKHKFSPYARGGLASLSAL